MEISSFGSLGEWRNEEGNEKKNKEHNEEGNKKGDSHILANGRCFWQGVDCDLINLDVGVFVASGHVITGDPWEIVFDDWLGEDHVGLNIFHCLSNVVTTMTIWKWSLSQTILDGSFPR
jgi:hypothetical protein